MSDGIREILDRHNTAVLEWVGKAKAAYTEESASLATARRYIVELEGRIESLSDEIKRADAATDRVHDSLVKELDRARKLRDLLWAEEAISAKWYRRWWFAMAAAIGSILFGLLSLSVLK